MPSPLQSAFLGLQSAENKTTENNNSNIKFKNKRQQVINFYMLYISGLMVLMSDENSIQNFTKRKAKDCTVYIRKKLPSKSCKSQT